MGASEVQRVLALRRFAAMFTISRERRAWALAGGSNADLLAEMTRLLRDSAERERVLRCKVWNDPKVEPLLDEATDETIALCDSLTRLRAAMTAIDRIEQVQVALADLAELERLQAIGERR